MTTQGLVFISIKISLTRNLSLTLNCSGVRLDKEKLFFTPGPWTKLFECIFCPYSFKSLVSFIPRFVKFKTNII